MLAAILSSPGNIELRHVDVPAPSDGELLIKVKASLTCGTDLKAYFRGHSLIPMPGPFGHEFSGVVAETGRGVRGFRKGDPVMAVHSGPCLRCVYCKKGAFNLCEEIMSSKVLGAFAEYVLIPKHIVRQNVFRKPDGLGFREAAFLEPLACVVHGMAPLNFRNGDSVLIIGAGPIGLLHMLLAKARGAAVIMSDLENERLKTAKKLGADRVADPLETAEEIREITGGLGADFVVECTGQPSVWESSVDYVRKGGTVVLFGGCKAGTTVTFDAGRLHYDEICLRGTFHFTPADVKKAFQLLKDGTINVKKLISGTYPLTEIQTAFSRLLRGDGIKYAIIP